MLIPVILSGGAGTRLWPVSREGHPKPMMNLAEEGFLLSKTYMYQQCFEYLGMLKCVKNDLQNAAYPGKDKVVRYRGVYVS